MGELPSVDISHFAPQPRSGIEIVFVDPNLPAQDIEYYMRLVEIHNPNDVCQNVVRESCIAVLEGAAELPSPEGKLYMTNGAAGYDPYVYFPDREIIGMYTENNNSTSI